MSKKDKNRFGRRALRRTLSGVASILLAFTVCAIAVGCCAGCAYLTGKALRAGWGE